MASEPNERLRAAIAAAGLRFEDVAAKTGNDPKTVERWITRGRIPHRNTRILVTELLDIAPEYLWPSTAGEARTQAASVAELVQFYPSRSTVPDDLWRSLTGGVREAMDLLVYSSTFMFESHDLANVVRQQAAAGVKFRFLLGDQTGDAVRRRAQEEGTEDYLERACQLSRRYLRDLNGYHGGVEVRTHDSTLYNSIYRFDEDLLVNTHVAGSPAGQNPVLHLRRIPGGRLWSHYMQSFERVWSTGIPEPPGEMRSDAEDSAAR